MKVEIRTLEANSYLLAHLSEEFRSSQHIWGGFANGELVVVWGLQPASALSDTAYIWSWTSAVVKKYRRPYIRFSKTVVNLMLEEYPILVGLCEEKSHWLCWLGARFGGPNGKYISFVIER